MGDPVRSPADQPPLPASPARSASRAPYRRPAGSSVPFRGLAWVDGQLARLDDPDGVASAMRSGATCLWVDLDHEDQARLSALAGCLGLHPLVVEDILEQNQRAKVELTEDVLHLVMFALHHDGELEATEIDFVLGERFILTAHGPRWDPHGVPHFRGGAEPFLAGGPDYVLWALVDSLVDGYFPVFDELGDRLDELQDEVIARPSRALIERLFRLKSDTVVIRHAISPQREIFNQLTNREMRLVRPERIIYFRDVYDHLIRLTDELDTYRDTVGTTLDAYLTTVNNDLSEVMKRLTAVTVVVAGVGALAGFFGMSEAPAAAFLTEPIGFWVIVVAILALAVIATAYFRRIGWL